jgi:inner membrane protein
MLGLIDSLGPWAWVIAGLVLMGLEMVAPGVFLLWLGLAAVVTGLIDAAFGLSWQASSLLFAALAVASVLLGRSLTRSRTEGDEADRLNRRGEVLIGRVLVLEQPIAAGEGRVRVDDTSWRVLGPDAPAGSRVRVARVEGAALVVEAA